MSGESYVAQGPTPYRTNETDKHSLSKRDLAGASDSEYVQFWKDWWTAMKLRVTSDNTR